MVVCRLCKKKEGKYETVDTRKMFFNSDGSKTIILCETCLTNYDNDEYVINHIRQTFENRSKNDILSHPKGWSILN